MPLSATSPSYLHILQNISLIVLALSFIPLSTAILVISLILSNFPFMGTKKNHLPGSQQCSASKRVLVTGVGMSKGLFIARSFHKAGHIVIGADFEPLYVPVCGRFSSALQKFYSLPTPTAGKDKYIRTVIEIVKSEKVDIWVSCSGVVTATEDGEAAEAVEKYTQCRTIQFGKSVTRLLHEKHSFIENTEKLGLTVPETILVSSTNEAMKVLNSGKKATKYVLKSVGVVDSIRADMTLLPLSCLDSTRKHLSKFRISPSRPFVLQQFIRGPEYCTHAILIRGHVAAFTACKSAELLMHYNPLPRDDPMSRAMLTYTRAYAERMHAEMTGHFSIDFLLDETEPADDLEKRLYPIECNPRAHTAVVNFGEQTQGMVDAYLDVLPSHKPGVFISNSATKHYWIGYDIATRFFLPVVSFLARNCSLGDVTGKWMDLLDHILHWRDPTYEIWDPWPAWWLYSIYWPCMFLLAIVRGKWWSRCNVSTGKIFGC